MDGEDGVWGRKRGKEAVRSPRFERMINVGFLCTVLTKHCLAGESGRFGGSFCLKGKENGSSG